MKYVCMHIKDLLYFEFYAIFETLVSQGSTATSLRYAGIYNAHFVYIYTHIYIYITLDRLYAVFSI